MGLPKRRALAAILAVFVVALGLFVVFRPGDQASAGVDLGDPHAWVEHGLDGELLQINAVTGEVTARIDVAEPGENFNAVAHADGAVVLNNSTNSIALVSGQLLSVTSTIPLAPSDLAGGVDPSTDDAEEPTDEGEVSEPSELAVYGSPDLAGNVVVVSEQALVTIDPQTSLASPLPLSAPLQSVTQDAGGRVTALSPEGGGLLQLDRGALAELAPLAAPVGEDRDERSLVRSGDGIYIVDPSRLSIAQVRSDGTYGIPFCTTSAAMGAVTGGSGPNDEPVILAYNSRTSTLNVSSLADGCRDIDVNVDGDDFGRPVATGGMAYIPNWSSGRIVVVDLEESTVVANFPFGTRGIPFELEVVGSNVWANEPQGPFAAVVTAETITPVPKISTIVAGSTSDVESEGEGSSLTSGSESASGLRIIGDSGDRVIASGSNAQQSGSGVGTGPAGGDIFGGDNPSDVIEASAVGIELDGLADPEPVGTGDGEADGEDEPDEVPEVIETLVANFSVSTGTATEGEVLRFTDTSTGSPVSWTWDFGDGTGAQEPNVEKAWDKEGVYVVSLEITNARGDESTQLIEITVVPEAVLLVPAADFSFDRSTIEAGESVTLTNRTTGEVDLLEWDFGDGESSVGDSAKHTYDTAGTYTVTLTASNAAGSSSTSTKITVLSGVEPPTAAIAPIPTSVVEGQFVTLKSASLNAPTRLSWDLGDGTTGSGQSLKHAWDTPGTYRIRLTAENSEGSDSTFTDVTVTRRIDPPVSQFTQSATEVLVGETVTFTNLSLNDPTKLIWNFGDDTTKRGETATKSWSKPGRYRVTLRATNDAGTNRTGVTITVVRPVEEPVAAFTASAAVVGPGTQVNFQDTSANNPKTWRWDFGDGTSASTANASKTWTEPGTYTVRLVAANDAGSSTAERQVVVKSAPSANFRWATVEGTTIKFTDTSWDDPQNWRWDFGDGTTSTDRSPTHTFAPGNFDVTLVVSNEIGTSAPKTQRVAAVEPPVAVAKCEADGARLLCSAADSLRASLYTWSVPEAKTNSAPNAETTVLTFSKAGRFEVTLNVSSNGVFNSTTITAPRVTAGLKPPVARPECEADGPRLICTGEESARAVEFTWSADGAVTNSTPNQRSTVFTFNKAGRFDVTLTVANREGVTDAETIRAPRVSKGQKPSVTSVSVAGTDGDLVRLRAQFENEPTSWQWQVDGAELVEGGNSPEPLFRVSRNGVFNGEVKATNAFGTDTDPISFEASPFTTTASFTWRVVEPGVVRFRNTSQARPDAQVEWRFAGQPEILDGNPDGPLVRYSDAGGTFRAVIIVEDQNGRSVYREDVTVPPVVVEEPEPPEENDNDE